VLESVSDLFLLFDEKINKDEREEKNEKIKEEKERDFDICFCKNCMLMSCCSIFLMLMIESLSTFLIILNDA